MSVRVNLSPEAIDQLNELAGGERHKSEYLEKMIPLLHRATRAAAQAMQQHRVQVLTEAVTVALMQEEANE